MYFLKTKLTSEDFSQKLILFEFIPNFMNALYVLNLFFFLRKKIFQWITCFFLLLPQLQQTVFPVVLLLLFYFCLFSFPTTYHLLYCRYSLTSQP
jgi:hypothetical protein